MEYQPYVRYAGFWVRVIASILDGIIMGIPISILTLIFFGLKKTTGFSGSDFFNYALSFIFTVLFWTHWDGRTPGKKLMGIKVVSSKDFQPINWATAVIRYAIGYTLSTIIFLIGFIMVAFRDDKRGLHDLIAETCVIYE